MKIRAIVACTSILLTAGCAGSSAKRTTGAMALGGAQASQPSDPKVVCEMERTVGSMIPERVCRSVELSEAQRAATQEALRKTLSTTTQGTIQ